MLFQFHHLLFASASCAIGYRHHANLQVETTSHTVDLGYATYRGLRLAEEGVDQYLGMRYAAPPLGDLRFRAPQDPISESGIQNASSVNLDEIPRHVQ
jgi:carboxylesterase type B